MRKIFKKAVAGLVMASLITSLAPMTTTNVYAASVVKGQYDFSNMTVRRVWFSVNDPVFLVDNYQRVWLDENVNALAIGDCSKTTAQGNLMAPMGEMFSYIGGVYTESGDTVTIAINGQTLKFTVGSKDVEIDGKAVAGALTDDQIPSKINVKETFADFNTYLTDDYYLTYLPVAYVLNTIGADVYQDSNTKDFYAAVPIFNTENVPSFEMTSKNYGNRYDAFVEGALNDTYEAKKEIADNIVALQNADGGWAVLADNTEMAQADLAAKLGTMKDESSLENGSTVAQLRYLAKYITEKKPTDKKYEESFVKGINFIVDNQNANGGWSMKPTDKKGFNANTAIGNDVTTEVLTLLNDVAILNNQNFWFARQVMTVDGMKAAVEKGNKFLVNSQIANDGVKAGWATQVKDDMSVTMGRTYERESVSAFTTKAVVEYLMNVYNPSQDIIDAVNSGVEWLKSVKLADKELKVVTDTTMNNGFDVYLVDGSGTWASNYVYDAAAKAYRPLYSDVDPTRADADFVNSYDYADLTSKEKKFIFYATRTTIDYYDNTLATELIDADYATWKGYLVNGFPEIPVDTPATGDAAGTTLFMLLAVASLATGCVAIKARSKKTA